MIEKIRVYTREAGRDPKSVGIEGRIMVGQGSPEQWTKEIQAWKELGATHVTANTMKAGFSSPSGHVEALRRFRAVFAER